MQTIAFSAPDNAMARAAEEIVLQLRQHGFECFWVGGAVRDMLMEKAIHDIDLVTNAAPERLAKIFPDLKTVGKSFGVHLIHRGRWDFELAVAREERTYLDGRHPELVRYTTDFDVDAQRRDFTVNALLFDPVGRKVLDYVGGIEDLKHGIIRSVGDPERRFKEDYLRMLRLVRFAADLGFEIDCATWQSACKHAADIGKLAKERIRSEVTRMLLGRSPARAMQLLAEAGMMDEFLPEVSQLQGVQQSENYHPEGDVFVHTMLMLEHFVPSGNSSADEILVWAVLLHDIGKRLTQTVDAQGQIHFFGHEAEGAKMVASIAERLRFRNNDAEAIAELVRRHMTFSQVAEMRPAKLKRFLALDLFPSMLELNRLDCIACHKLMGAFVFLLDKLCAEAGARRLPPPLVNGMDLKAAGYLPGPQYSTILNAIRDAQLSGQLQRKDEALIFLKKNFEISR